MITDNSYTEIEKGVSRFKQGASLTFIVGLAIIFMSLIMGKQTFFLLLNGNLGSYADFFFTYCTKGGEEWPWIVTFLLIAFCNRFWFPLYLSSLILSTILVQTGKHYFFADAPRPILEIANHKLIHTVEGVVVNQTCSFPSGHTSSAFTLFLVLCFLVRWKWVAPVGFVIALLVGYSRVYLAQHFPVDVGAGMLTAVISVSFGCYIQAIWLKRSERKELKRN